MKPRLLDLFCGAGGAAMGYHRAGFEVVGVDAKPMPNYPFEFIQADAIMVLDALLGHVDARWHSALDQVDAIHASPPCQRYSVATVFHPGRQPEHPDLVDPVRDRLMEIDRSTGGTPWVIENVMGAPLRNPIMLCGTMFDGLKVYRHRLFEARPPIYWPPYHNPHMHRPTEVGRRVAEHGWMTVAGHFSWRGGGWSRDGNRLDDSRRAGASHPARLYRMDRTAATQCHRRACRMSRILTAALFLLAARAAYRRGYMDARVDAVLPYWHVPRKRVEWALRQVG